MKENLMEQEQEEEFEFRTKHHNLSEVSWIQHEIF